MIIDVGSTEHIDYGLILSAKPPRTTVCIYLFGSDFALTNWIGGIEQTVPDDSVSDDGLCDLSDLGRASPGITTNYQSSDGEFSPTDYESNCHRNGCEPSDSNNVSNSADLPRLFMNAVSREHITNKLLTLLLGSQPAACVLRPRQP